MKVKIDIGFSNDFIENQINLMKENYSCEFVFEEHTGLLDVDYLLATKLETDALKSANRLVRVFVPFTGINKFPLEALRAKGIGISNTHAKAHIVAERALAMTLSVMGKLNIYDKALRDNQRWLTREFWGGEFWNSLYSKKCGIIGMGAIGKHIKALLLPFKCEIINLKRDVNKKLADYYVDDLEEMIQKSDVLFFTCALNDATKHLINLENVHLLKNKVIINVSRGEVIQEEALFKALDEKIVLGAGIDVWYAYPRGRKNMCPSTYDLSRFDNLIMSPHASCHAVEEKDAYYQDIFNQLKSELMNSN